MNNTREKILRLAEQMIRTGGVNGFSFREIAQEIGIKSASVHHYFPTKEDLTLEVAQCSKKQFLASLATFDAECQSPKDKLQSYCDLFINLFQASELSCPFGVLFTESHQLPDSVKQVVLSFVAENISWLEIVLKEIHSDDKQSSQHRGKAEMIFCSIEAAMGVATLQGDKETLVNICDVVMGLVE